MKIDEAERLLGLRITDNQRLAAAFLESQGLRFCCEYGYENAELMAIQLMDRVTNYSVPPSDAPPE